MAEEKHQQLCHCSQKGEKVDDYKGAEADVGTCVLEKHVDIRKVQMEITAQAAIGIKGFAFQKHHKQKEVKKEDEKKHQHLFFHKESREAIDSKQEKHPKYLEHLGKLGIDITGACALNEKYKEKIGLAHAHIHNVKAQIGEAAVRGAEEFIFQKHLGKKEAKKNKELHEKKHHHLFYPHKKSQEAIDYKEEEKKHHEHLECFVKLGAGITGTSALNEKHKEEKDLEHVQIHKAKVEIAAATAKEVEAFTFQEHHEEKEAKKKDEEVHEKKHCHLLYHEKESEENIDYNEEEKHQKHLEDLSKLDVGNTGACTLHEEKKISENAHSHKVKAEVEAGAAAGATGFAFHEHHDKKEAKKEDEVLLEKNHYYHLYHHKESENVVDYKEEEKYYKHSENLGRLDVAATGAHALHEKREERKDSESAYSHKIKEEIDAAAAIGAEGFAIHEQYEKKGGEDVIDYKEKEHYKYFEQLGEMDASTARAHALHEKREAEKAQEHAYNCEGNEKIVAMSAIEAKGFTFHEHHEKKEAKKKDEEEHEKNHRHLFYHQKESKENIDYKEEEKHHKLLEHLSKLSAGVTGDYALHEKKTEKKDLEHAHNHEIKAETVAVAITEAEGCAFHEHHKKKEAKKEDEVAYEKKHYYHKEGEIVVDYGEDKHHKYSENLSRPDVIAASVYALYEKGKEKKDLEHAHCHKIQEKKTATTVGGVEEFALHKHHEKKEGEDVVDYEKGKKHHKHFEHLSEMGFVSASTYALHDKNEAKKDQEHASSYEGKEETAAMSAVGAERFAFNEYHEKKEAKKEIEEIHGKKPHYLLYHYKESNEAIDYKEEEKRLKHLEHLGKLGHEENKDLEHAQSHKVKVNIGAASGERFAFLEHHKLKGANQENKEAHGEKHYRQLFYRKEGNDVVDYKEEEKHNIRSMRQKETN
ncbi:uncharacterized protein LOC110603184 isoform X3 [Manihot esculenta]|uniref:uncharacterized protein LOC110603184 isoform X3 n=1 Tax=Manihot esculenta TaxID=3983 RepID=UPI000B5D3882|nr:uncharacterized protein LOC110603184 isoform X3 [Manihot esculenta]